MTEVSEKRREIFDEQLLKYLKGLAAKKPIVWGGDNNVAQTNEDVSHPAFFAAQGIHGQPG